MSNDDPYYNVVVDDFEKEFTTVVNTLVPRDGVCIDIGANIGIKTFILSRHCKDGAVLSLEAGRGVFDILTMNARENSLNNVILENIVVGETNGSAHFLENSAFGHIDSNRGELVPMKTLGTVFAKHNFKRLDFLKVDVEGFEIPILQGSMDIIRQYNPVIHLEFNTFCHTVFEVGKGSRSLLRWLLDTFKHVYHINHVNGEITPAQWSENEQERNTFIETLLYRIMVYDGLYDDFIVTNNSDMCPRIAPLLSKT